MSAFGPVSPRRATCKRPNRRARPIAPDEAVEIARALYPSASVTSVGLPSGPRGAYRVSLREPGDASARIGPVVFLDPRTRAVLQRADRATRTGGDRFLVWQRILHEGEAFGVVGRVVICITGLLPPLLVVTGTMIWLRQRRKPRAADVGVPVVVAGSDA